MQAKFVEEYLVDLNATQAAIRAGYSAKTAASQGERLLRNVEIQTAISAARKAQANRTEITADRVLKEYARLAFYDIRKLVREDGSPKPLHELDDDTAAAIAGLDIASVGNAEIGIGQVLKFKLASKHPALDALAEHLGMKELGIQTRREGDAATQGQQNDVTPAEMTDDELESLERIRNAVAERKRH